MTKRKPRCKLHTFTAEEDMVLHQLYPRATRNRIRNALWYIAWSTIERRAKVLGIVRTFVRVKNHGKPTYRPRDPKERQQQREFWEAVNSAAWPKAKRENEWRLSAYRFEDIAEPDCDKYRGKRPLPEPRISGMGCTAKMCADEAPNRAADFR